MELEKGHWINAKQDNVNILLTSKYQIILAEQAIKLCEEKIAEFPEEKKADKLT